LWVITQFHRCVCARFVFYWHHTYSRWWAKGVRNVVRIWQRKKLFFNLVYVFKLWGGELIYTASATDVGSMGVNPGGMGGGRVRVIQGNWAFLKGCKSNM
jgi:hypothetical protein